MRLQQLARDFLRGQGCLSLKASVCVVQSQHELSILYWTKRPDPDKISAKILCKAPRCSGDRNQGYKPPSAVDARLPDARSIVLTTYLGDAQALRALKAGGIQIFVEIDAETRSVGLHPN